MNYMLNDALDSAEQTKVLVLSSTYHMIFRPLLNWKKVQQSHMRSKCADEIEFALASGGKEFYLVGSYS